SSRTRSSRARASSSRGYSITEPGTAPPMDAIYHNFFNIPIMLQYLPELIAGFWVTIWLSVLVVVTGLVLGLALAVVRAFQFKPVNALIVILVDVMRAIPPLV